MSSPFRKVAKRISKSLGLLPSVSAIMNLAVCSISIAAASERAA
jgi:hypothetical protein